ncbi:hypothetical protein F5050DRAFT_545165 [Lentinula boryana]|uniref:Uncharacterized protein n=1 Tax=Lentinula boryana TaxID=40481 RepID=A0ABQ8Q756_9AGAR|nr:hypothetical protein F5050DRAFT_545165 [Lentinula boryana]
MREHLSVHLLLSSFVFIVLVSLIDIYRPLSPSSCISAVSATIIVLLPHLTGYSFIMYIIFGSSFFFAVFVKAMFVVYIYEKLVSQSKRRMYVRVPVLRRALLTKPSYISHTRTYRETPTCVKKNRVSINPKEKNWTYEEKYTVNGEIGMQHLDIPRIDPLHFSELASLRLAFQWLVRMDLRRFFEHLRECLCNHPRIDLRERHRNSKTDDDHWTWP